jgi:putative N6-adenine-specific DNA methylase
VKKQPSKDIFSDGPVSAFAIAAPGLSSLVEDELRELGVAVSASEPAGVAFTATAPELLTANLWSRIASRIIVRIAHFTARDFATLERRAKAIDWSLVIPPASVVRLRVTCRKSRLYHSDAVAERVARAIESRVKGARVDQRGTEDDEGDDHTQLIIVRFDHDECTISADSSGALLHRRGWRQAIAKAPLRETLAAAMLRACDWNGDRAMVDPFCGSGTIGIEAALRARNIAPGLGRTFAMESWSGASSELSKQLRRDASTRMVEGTGVPIVMSDRDAGACAAAVANAERAGVAGDVTIVQRALSDVNLADIAGEGLLLTNPPYGQRVSEGADLRGLYSRLGDILREGGNWQLAMLAPEQRLEVPLEMRLHKLFKTSNGGIEVSLQSSVRRLQRRP